MLAQANMCFAQGYVSSHAFSHGREPGASLRAEVRRLRNQQKQLMDIVSSFLELAGLPASLLPRLSALAQGLQQHHDLDVVNGHHKHFHGAALQAAAPQFSPDEVKHMRKVKRKSDTARHAAFQTWQPVNHTSTTPAEHQSSCAVAQGHVTKQVHFDMEVSTREFVVPDGTVLRQTPGARKLAARFPSSPLASATSRAASAASAPTTRTTSTSSPSNSSFSSGSSGLHALGFRGAQSGHQVPHLYVEPAPLHDDSVPDVPLTADDLALLQGPTLGSSEVVPQTAVGSEGSHDSEHISEATRASFLEFLVTSPRISGTTIFAEADRMFAFSPVWQSLPKESRRELFLDFMQTWDGMGDPDAGLFGVYDG